VIDSLPPDHDIASATWTRQAVAELIAKRMGVDLTLQGVGQYLRRWGLTPKKPARQAREQDSKEVEEFVQETLPEVKEQAQEEDAQLYSCILSIKSVSKRSIRSARTMRPKATRQCRRFPRVISSRM
jgi:hypothetical protein